MGKHHCSNCGDHTHNIATCKEPCGLCKKKGHVHRDCPDKPEPKPKKARKARFAPGQSRCSKCGQPGHNRLTCKETDGLWDAINPVQVARDRANQARIEAHRASDAAEKAAVAAREAERQAAGKPKRSMHLTAQQHLDALRRLKRFIMAQPEQGRHTGGELVAWDCNQMGAKDTECSWGQCTRRPEQWPEDTRMWPDRQLLDGRVYGVKSHQNGQFCPFDRRAPEGDIMHNMTEGCFYRCRVFQAKKDKPRPTREEALRLFEWTIAEYQAEGYKLTAAHEERRRQWDVENTRPPL